MRLTHQQKVDLVAAEIRRALRERANQPATGKPRFSEMAAEIAVTEIEKLEEEHTDD